MSTEMPPSRPDPAAATRLQILATEHWSLLATRSLTYTESLARINIFLAILSSTMIALALIAQVDHFGPAFIAVAIPLLVVVAFTGVYTISRLEALNRDDYRWVIGMNRLRHAYVELHPEIEPYLTTSPYDDLAGALVTLGVDPRAEQRIGSVLRHLPATLPGMLTVIVGAVDGAIVALIAVAFGSPRWAIAVAAAAGFVLTLVLLGLSGRRSVRRVPLGLEPRFPSPPGGAASG
jgi:hypothetical protein